MKYYSVFCKKQFFKYSLSLTAQPIFNYFTIKFDNITFEEAKEMCIRQSDDIVTRLESGNEGMWLLEVQVSPFMHLEVHGFGKAYA